MHTYVVILYWSTGQGYRRIDLKKKKKKLAKVDKGWCLLVAEY